MKRKVLSIILFIFAIVLIACAPDVEKPVITEFTLPNGVLSAEATITIKLEGTDNVGITSWIVSEDDTTPTKDDSRWVNTKPTSFTFQGSIDTYLCAWAKDAADNISDVKTTIAAYHSATITEDTTNWNKLYHGGDWDWLFGSSCMAVDGDDNIYVVGGTDRISANGDDGLIKKYSKDGVEDTTNWDKLIHNSSLDWVYSVITDSSNNVYVGAGTSVSSSMYWWLKKYDSSGTEDTTNWNKLGTTNGGTGTAPKSVAIDSEGNIYFGGSGYGLVNILSDVDWWLRKFNPNGTEITTGWNKKINSKDDAIDEICSISIDSENNVYAFGYATNYVGSSTGWDWWIKKFDKDGNEDTTNWNKSFDGGTDRTWGSAIDKYDNVYFVGSGENLVNSGSGWDIWIKKFDKNGVEDTVNWDKKIDGNGGMDTAVDIVFDNRGFIYIVGKSENAATSSSDDDGFIIKFSSSGSELWRTAIDIAEDDEMIFGCVVDNENNLYIAGYGYNLLNSTSRRDWFIKKYIVAYN